MRGVDLDLIEQWLRARSIGRGLPHPIRDRGGLRVDTATAAETRRYAFARPSEDLRELAYAIDAPRIPLKLAGTHAEMAPLLPPRWQIAEPGFLMVGDAAVVVTASPLPVGYRLDLSTVQATTTARILDADGEAAACGYAVEDGGVFVYDRIVTEPAHRRRGLGRALMAALASARRSDTALPLLVATPEGRALYESLGWSVRSPWTTAVIPDETAD